MSKETGGLAFPSHGSMGEVVQEGMTLRDYFAAKAMQGMLADPNVNAEAGEWKNFKYILADDAYEIADAMLKARDE